MPAGQIFGFLGANGAGKTTTMRIALGVLAADRGRILWDGADTRELPRRTWGYLPEERGLYPRMLVLDQLVFFASLQGMPRDIARKTALDWLRRLRVTDLAFRKAEELSKGNQQKIQMISADPPRPACFAHGRAVHRARSRERGSSPRDVAGAPRRRPHADLLHPPDGDG